MIREYIIQLPFSDYADDLAEPSNTSDDSDLYTFIDFINQPNHDPYTGLAKRVISDLIYYPSHIKKKKEGEINFDLEGSVTTFSCHSEGTLLAIRLLSYKNLPNTLYEFMSTIPDDLRVISSVRTKNYKLFEHLKQMADNMHGIDYNHIDLRYFL